jgi:uncharacterized repeat protein (TIGR01451 family)
MLIMDFDTKLWKWICNCSTIINKHQPFLFGFIFRTAFLSTMFLFLSLISPSEVFAQGSENTALWSENGYSLKKVVSNTTIASGVNFSYTIIFSAPAGVTSISIQDQVPAALQVVSVTAAGPVCTVSPVTGVSGNLVTYNLTALPGSCAPSGSFTIVVKFPEGVTCDGAAARNRAEILIDDKWQPTPYVTTTATAVNPWEVTKTIISGASVNPNGGSCGYIMAPGDTITYRLAVLKDNPYWGNVVGQQNMSSAVVTDLLPSGAQFVSSSNPCATHPGGTGGTITWNVNCPTQLLDAANPWAYYWVDIKVAYPAGSFPVSTQILNQATLTGVSCNQQEAHTSNQTCITVTQPNPSGSFSKWLSLTNRVPGCSGLYIISFCNNGNVPLSAFNINDNIPSGITVNQIQISGANSTTSLNLNINSTPFATGLNTFYSSGTISSPVSNVQVQMTNNLPVGGCIYIYIYFTINPNPTGTVVTNCATLDPLANSLSLPQVCASFTVEGGTPKPCLIKDVCDLQSSYDPGDIVRFRLRIQNIGSADLIGAAIQDVLHSNFTYIGNETYYSANTYNVPCSTGGIPPAGTSAWSGVTPSHSGNNLSWNLPDIAADCQLFYAAYCGYYGTWGIPYYYIEFDAQVNNYALPGVTPNSYQVSGGNLPAPVISNTVNILVVASFGQEVHKLLSTDNGANYSSSGTVAPGSTARFRLNYKNTSNVPVSSIGLTDLLGRDDGTNDWLIFNRTMPRGSQFDVSYIGNHATSLVPVATPPVPNLSWAPGQNICLPPYVTTGCTTSAFGAVPDRNVRAAYGTIFSLAPNSSLNEDFDVGIPLTALNAEMVCNDFAAIASANFLLNGNPQSVALTPVAAPPVCLTIDTTLVSVSCCDSVLIERAVGADGMIGCCARIATTCEVDSVAVSISNGTFSSSSWNCGNMPGAHVGQSSYTFVGNNCVVDMVNCIDPDSTGTVVISYVVYFANGEVCEKRLVLDCEVEEPPCCDSVRVEISHDATGAPGCCARITTTCEVDSVAVNISNGTFSSSSWNCGNMPGAHVGQSSYTFIANNCVVDMVNCIDPDSTGTVVISYVVYFANGEVCEKRLVLDCEVEEPPCCDSVRVEISHDATGAPGCCARITTTCEVDSVAVSISNGTFSSSSWNCGNMPGAHVGQSSYTFIANNCVVDMVNCIDPDSTGTVVISYVVYFANGEVCEKRLVLDCEVEEPKCCENVKLEKYTDPHGTEDCCVQLTTECEVKSVAVSVTNGTIASAAWNCGTLPAGYIGQSNFTFAPGNCALDMKLCVNATTTGLVVINYVITFENGEVCEKRIELDCKAVEETCCALADFKLKTKWPFWKSQVGTFNIINADPSVPICYVEINAVPAATFSMGSLIVDGVASSQAWNPTRIPATGNLSPAAVNTIDFSLTASNYKGIITVCVVKCDGTRCCFEFKWNGMVVIDVDVDIDKDPIKTGLVAVRISPVVEDPGERMIKYVSFGLTDEAEVEQNVSEFFAISASPHEGDDYPANLETSISSYMGKNSAFFELASPKSAAGGIGFFNLVFAGKMPKLGCTLYDVEGDILYSGEITIVDEDTISTSYSVLSAKEAGNMFEFINLYPSPSDGNFTITYVTGTPRDVEIRLVSLTGQVLHVQDNPGIKAGVHNVGLTIARLPAGIYNVVLVSEGEVLSKSLIIQ